MFESEEEAFIALKKLNIDWWALERNASGDAARLEILRDVQDRLKKLDRIEDLLKRAFENVDDDLLFHSMVTLALIELSDILSQLSVDGERVDFKDEFVMRAGGEGDLTSLIADARNVACHVQSKLNTSGQSCFRWCILHPKTRVLGFENASDRDLLIVFGSVQVYFLANIVSASMLARRALTTRIL